MSNIDTAAMYLRKSRAEESEALSEVLARHKATLEEAARRHNIIISEYYEEVVSGENLYSRPEMIRLLEDVDAGKHQAVLCMDIDRLGRGGMRDQGIILDTFRESDTLIITPDKIYDLTNDEDEEMTEFKAFFARREYKMIRKRMRRGLLRTIAEGGYVSNAPFGYKNVRKGKIPTLEQIPDEVKCVRYMFSRYLEGAGTHIIAAEINAMGSRPHRSNAWSRSSVRNVIRNPVYYGAVPWNRVKWTMKDGKRVSKHLPPEEWMLSDGVHEPVITRDVFELAQNIRTSRGMPVARFTGEMRNPMAGVLRCSQCGLNLQRMGDNKGVPYILCRTKGCSAGAKSEFVEHALLRSIEQDISQLKLDIRTPHNTSTANISTMISGLKKEIDKSDKRRLMLFEFLEDGTYTKDEFLERKEKLEGELIALRAALVENEHKKAQVLNKDKKKLIKRLEHVINNYWRDDTSGRNALLKSVIETAYYTKQKKTKPSDLKIEVVYR